MLLRKKFYTLTTTGTRRDTHSVSICLSHAVRHTDICVSHRRRGSVARIAAGSVVQSVGGEVPLPMGDSFLSCRRSARCTAAEGGAGEDGARGGSGRDFLLRSRKFEEIHVQHVAIHAKPADLQPRVRKYGDPQWTAFISRFWLDAGLGFSSSVSSSFAATPDSCAPHDRKCFGPAVSTYLLFLRSGTFASFLFKTVFKNYHRRDPQFTGGLKAACRG